MSAELISQTCKNLYTGDQRAQREARELLARAFPNFDEEKRDLASATSDSDEFVRQQLGFLPCKSPVESCKVLQSLVNSMKSDVFCVLYSFQHIKQLAVKHCFVLTAEFRKELLVWLYSSLLDASLPDQQAVVNAAADAMCSLARVDYFESGLELCRLVESSWQSTNSNSYAQTRVWFVSQRFIEVINSPETSKFALSRHRKAANHFRDSFLLKLVVHSIQELAKFSGLKTDTDEKFVCVILSTLTKCVNFDFLGTNTEDSVDDLGSIQVPNSWRPAITDSNLRATLSEINRNCRQSSPVTPILAELLYHLAGIRRSIFPDATRVEFVEWLFYISMELVKMYAQSSEYSGRILFNFCIMAARIATVQSKADLKKCQFFSDWLEFVGNMSLHLFDSEKWVENVDANWFQTTLYHLLSFWEKMVLHVDYTGDKPSWQIKTLEMVRVLVQKFVQAGHTCCERHPEFMMDELADESSLVQILDCLAPMVRRTFADSSAVLLQLFSSSQPSALSRAWAIYVSACVVGSRNSYRSPADSEHDPLDMLLAVQVVVGARNCASLCLPVVLGSLHFFSQFYKAHIADSERQRVVYEHLDASTNTAIGMLEFINFFIFSTLDIFPMDAKLCERATLLFSELSTGYSAIRLMTKTHKVLQLLQYPLQTADDSQELPKWIVFQGNKKARMQLVQTLANILCSGQEQSQFEVEFYHFISTFDHWQRQEALMESQVAYFEQFCNDVRTVARAITHETPFHLLLHWFLPLSRRLGTYSVTFLERWSQLSPSHVLLKLWTELVLNRGKRLNFPLGNPKAILLIREMCATAQPLLSRAADLFAAAAASSDENETNLVLKIVRKWFELLSNVLRGKFVSVGNMSLYGDTSFEQVLHSVLSTFGLLRSRLDLFEHTKLSEACFTFLETLSRSHIFTMSAVPSPLMDEMVQYLLHVFSTQVSLEEQTRLINSSCLCFENILTWVQAKQAQNTLAGQDVLCSMEVNSRFELYLKGAAESAAGAASLHWLVLYFMASDARLVKRVMHVLLKFALEDEDCSFTWTVARPLAVCIVLEPNAFVYYLERLVAAQLPERRRSLHQIFAAFLSSLHSGLESHLATQAQSSLATLGASSSTLHLHSQLNDGSRSSSLSHLYEDQANAGLALPAGADSFAEDSLAVQLSFPPLSQPIIIHDRIKDLVHLKISSLKRELSALSMTLIFPIIS